MKLARERDGGCLTEVPMISRIEVCMMKKFIIKFILVLFTFIIIFTSAVFSFFSWTLRDYSENNWDCL